MSANRKPVQPTVSVWESVHCTRQYSLQFCCGNLHYAQGSTAYSFAVGMVHYAQGSTAYSFAQGSIACSWTWIHVHVSQGFVLVSFP